MSAYRESEPSEAVRAFLDLGYVDVTNRPDVDIAKVQLGDVFEIGTPGSRFVVHAINRGESPYVMAIHEAHVERILGANGGENLS